MAKRAAAAKAARRPAKKRAAPAKVSAKASARKGKTSTKRATRGSPAKAAKEPNPLEWAPADAQPARPAPAQATALPFNPTTGEWLPAQDPQASASPAAAQNPAGFRRGTGAVILSVLLGIDIAIFALGLLFGIIGGSALVFAPDSPMAERFRDNVGESSPGQLVQGTALSLVMFGVVPFFWVLGTRMKPWPGTRQLLALRFGLRDWLRGVALVPPLILFVAILSTLYVLATEGPSGLTGNNDVDNPAVQAIVDNLSWPVAIFIALSAGIGEEIFFRGVLQRWIGVWGQAIAFGLAHAGGGYVPQILFATSLGVLFGWLLKRGWSLWTLILAHALYDFVLLALALLFPEFA